MKKKLHCVLLVDDNESDNFFHKRVIEQAGITDFIAVAQNGQEALDFLKSNALQGQNQEAEIQPSLIFLDINMPVMNGWEFLDEYQNLDEFQKGRVIIVMLSASLNPSDFARTEKIVGSGCFIYKPLTKDSLGELMQKHFREYL